MLAYQDDLTTIYQGHAQEELRGLPSGAAQMCVNSPPYYGLRSYLPADHPDKPFELGSEKTPQEYVEKLVGIFREVRRVLRDDGTLWLNLGDSYSGGGRGRYDKKSANKGNAASSGLERPILPLGSKQLLGIPWRVALALQDDGWYLRQDIIWNKPSCMPSSVKDRCTTAHEYLFLLSKSPRYYFDHVAIMEPTAECSIARASRGVSEQNRWKDGAPGQTSHSCHQPRKHGEGYPQASTRNKRSVWTIATTPFKGSHFATFPPKLIEPCILAGTSEKGACPQCGAPFKRLTEKTEIKRERPNNLTERHLFGEGVNSCGNTVAGVKIETMGWAPTCKCGREDVVPCTVLDPFLGSGTTAMVSRWHGRHCIGIELSESYIQSHCLTRIHTKRKAA